MKVSLMVVVCALVLARIDAVKIETDTAGVQVVSNKSRSTKQARKLPDAGQMGQMGGFGGFMGGQNMLAMPSLTPPEPPGFTLGRMPVFGPGGPPAAPQLQEQEQNEEVDQKDQKAKNRKLFFPYMNPMMAMNPMMMMGGFMNPMFNPHMMAPMMNMAANSAMASVGHHIKGQAHMNMAMAHHGAGTMHSMMNPMMNPYMMGGMMNPYMMGMGGMMNPYMMSMMGGFGGMMNPYMMSMMGGFGGMGMNPYGGPQGFGGPNQQPQQQEAAAPQPAFSENDEKRLKRKLSNDEINTIFYAGELPTKMQREMNMQENLENAEINEQLGALEGVSKEDSNWIKEMDNNVSKL